VIEDITEHVFPGFAKFLKSQNWGWWLFGTTIEWFGGRFIIASGQKLKQ